MLFGECKWSNAPMDLRDLGGLRKAIAAAQRDLNPIVHPWRVCFAKAGFSPDLISAAASPDERLILIGPDQLYAI